MSTALLKFQQPEDAGLPGSAVLAAALAAFAEPVAIFENGGLVYRNGTFAELFGQTGQLPNPTSLDDARCQQTPFIASGRNFQLLRRRPSRHEPDSQHLALIGRLVSGVAHDFNNLLTGILLYCDLMEGKLAASDPMGRKISEIRVAAEQGAGLIRQLMKLGREEKDAPRAVQFNDALANFLPLLRHLVPENIHLAVELDERAGVVGISLAQAHQILLNLVLNARDAMPSGGEISLKTHLNSTMPGNHSLELTVKDCGTGIDAQTAALIFDPFFTTKASGHGTGVGLATVRKIVEEAGGEISVETACKQGTLVTVRLPEVDAKSKFQAEDNINSGLSEPELGVSL